MAVVAVLLLGIAGLWQRSVRLSAERDRYRSNTEVLLSDLKRMQVDSARTAVDVKSLCLTLDEYKRFRAKDAKLIKEMGIKIRTLEAAARHEVVVAGPIDAFIRDSVVMRDSIRVVEQRVEMVTPFIRLSGLIEDKRLKGDIEVPVILHQLIWVECKRRWIFWKRVKAVHQTISSDNPYVKIKYSEYIRIEQ